MQKTMSQKEVCFFKTYFNNYYGISIGVYQKLSN